jgi:hypothetical protein
MLRFLLSFFRTSFACGLRRFMPLRTFEIPFREGQPFESAYGLPPGDGRR